MLSSFVYRILWPRIAVLPGKTRLGQRAPIGAFIDMNPGQRNPCPGCGRITQARHEVKSERPGRGHRSSPDSRLASASPSA